MVPKESFFLLLTTHILMFRNLWGYILILILWNLSFSVGNQHVSFFPLQQAVSFFNFSTVMSIKFDDIIFGFNDCESRKKMLLFHYLKSLICLNYVWIFWLRKKPCQLCFPLVLCSTTESKLRREWTKGEIHLPWLKWGYQYTHIKRRTLSLCQILIFITQVTLTPHLLAIIR